MGGRGRTVEIVGLRINPTTRRAVQKAALFIHSSDDSPALIIILSRF
jgi:hypothetical protein